MNESSEDDGKVKTLNYFALCLLKDLQIIVKVAIRGGKFVKEQCTAITTNS